MCDALQLPCEIRRVLDNLLKPDGIYTNTGQVKL